MVIALIVVVGILVYAWVVYPAVMLVMMGRGRRVKGEALRTGSCEQDVVILFSAHNEEAVILKRMENLAALDYPADRLRIFVGIDGGSDRTSAIALEWARSHPAVQVIVSPDNHGKMAMLKRLVREIDHGPESSEEKSIEQKSLRAQREENCISAGGGKEKSFFASFATSVQISSSGAEVSGLGPNVSLLVFTDANTFFAPDALTRLVAPFSDPKIGGVCGRLVFKEPENQFEQKSRRTRREENCISAGMPAGVPANSRTQEGGGKENSSFASFATSVQDSSPGTDEAVYWDLETRLKEAESGLDSCLGANGAIYAIRSGLFPAGIPDNTIVDDFVIGMKVREQGYRMVFEPAAVATEDLPETVRDEWRRRVRIGAGAFQALALCRSCLSPRYGLFAGMFWSHKVLRWFTPHLAIGVSVVGFWLLVQTAARSPVACYWLLGAACMALIGLLPKKGRKLFRLLVYFVTIQAALFAGFLRYCRGGLKGTWERTERGEEKTSPLI
jgi:cellulose synthase/poly-beta-1,6-N-acetylglucosamine synthase-like glycosyltransferase